MLAGSVAAFVNWGSPILFNEFVDFRLALVAAYAGGMATAFVLHKVLVFPESGQALSKEIRYFVFFNVAAFPLVWGTSVLLAECVMPAVRFMWHPCEVAHAIAIALPLVLNFFLHKFIPFKPGRSYANDG